MRVLLENQMVLEPIEIKTMTGNFILETDSLSKCDVCEQNGKLYAYLKEINIYLPIKKSTCA